MTLDGSLTYKNTIAIIGGGPVGMFAIFACGMVGLHTAVFDTLRHLGGQCQALYPQKPIYDIPGFSAITGEDLISKLQQQIMPFKPTLHLGVEVIDIILRTDNSWSVIAKQGDEIHEHNYPAVIIACGAGAFAPRKPPLPIEPFEGESVLYSISDKELFRNKRVVICGGGDSAIDWAIELSNIATQVYLIHRRAQFKAMQNSQDRLQRLEKTGKLQIIAPAQLHSLVSDNNQLTGVKITTETEEKIIATDFLLPFYGLDSDLGHIKAWGLHIEHKGIAVDYATMQTNLSNIYAIGDIAIYKGKRKLILTGFSEASIAAQAIYENLYGHKLNMQHSTTVGVPLSEV